MEGERKVGALVCSEVLAKLSDYIDGRLPSVERAQVDEHLRGCDHCERFGGDFGNAVGALRRQLAAATAPTAGALARLRASLESKRER